MLRRRGIHGRRRPYLRRGAKVVRRVISAVRRINDPRRVGHCRGKGRLVEVVGRGSQVIGYVLAGGSVGRNLSSGCCRRRRSSVRHQRSRRRHVRQEWMRLSAIQRRRGPPCLYMSAARLFCQCPDPPLSGIPRRQVRGELVKRLSRYRTIVMGKTLDRGFGGLGNSSFPSGRTRRTLPTIGQLKLRNLESTTPLRPPPVVPMSGDRR